MAGDRRYVHTVNRTPMCTGENVFTYKCQYQLNMRSFFWANIHMHKTVLVVRSKLFVIVAN
jgi:hypothetical protein